MNPKVTSERLRRKAIVYVRQSSMLQVTHNLESQRRQYGLAAHARELGFHDIDVIDEDLGRSGSGCVERPGFQRLVTNVCSGEVGGVFCVEASRLARNGRDWHHLIERTRLAGAEPHAKLRENESSFECVEETECAGYGLGWELRRISRMATPESRRDFADRRWWMKRPPEWLSESH